jgi:hypothetical protein
MKPDKIIDEMKNYFKGKDGSAHVARGADAYTDDRSDNSSCPGHLLRGLLGKLFPGDESYDFYHKDFKTIKTFSQDYLHTMRVTRALCLHT